MVVSFRLLTCSPETLKFQVIGLPTNVAGIMLGTLVREYFTAFFELKHVIQLLFAAIDGTLEAAYFGVKMKFFHTVNFLL